MSETLTPTVPCHDNAEALQRTIRTKGEPTAQGMYPTDGTADVVEVEKRISALLGISQPETVAFNAGMTAVVQGIETALSIAPRNGGKLSIAFPQQSYSETQRLASKYRRYGIGITFFDSGDEKDVEATINERPSVIVGEIISNGPQMPALNEAHFHTTLHKIPLKCRPISVEDEKLSLSAQYRDGRRQLNRNDRGVRVLSGMKAITGNVEPVGVAYSANEEILEGLRRDRITERRMPTPASCKAILQMLLSANTPFERGEARHIFDGRNNRIFKNGLFLAQVLDQASQDGAPFTVRHPNIGNHANRTYVEKTFKDGIAPAPVLFLECDDTRINENELLTKLYDESPAVKAHSSIQQSFAFDRTVMVHPNGAPFVRIAAGANSDIEPLANALYEAALSTGK